MAITGQAIKWSKVVFKMLHDGLESLDKNDYSLLQQYLKWKIKLVLKASANDEGHIRVRGISIVFDEVFNDSLSDLWEYLEANKKEFKYFNPQQLWTKTNDHIGNKLYYKFITKTGKDWERGVVGAQQGNIDVNGGEPVLILDVLDSQKYIYKSNKKKLKREFDSRHGKVKIMDINDFEVINGSVRKKKKKNVDSPIRVQGDCRDISS